MDGPEAFDFNSVCRICLTTNLNLLPIFSSHEQINIPERLRTCTKIRVEQFDGLPGNICSVCIRSLNSSYEFHKLSEKSDRQLRRIWTQIQVQKEVEALQVLTSLENDIPDSILSMCTEKEDPQYLLCIEDRTDVTVPRNIELQSHTNDLSKITDNEPMKNLEACPICHKTMGGVRTHMRLFHRGQRFVCSKCNKWFTTRKNLNSHKFSCYDMKKEFKCSYCFKEFHRKNNWQAHVKRHQTPNIVCELCDHRFVDITGLRRHFLKHHEGIQETHVCHNCQKKFKSQTGLKKHLTKCKEKVSIMPTDDTETKCAMNVINNETDSAIVPC